ncbi:hypothetical protein HKD37_10G027787 [Glycine soja]
MPTQTLTPSSPPSTTTGGHHEPSLLSTEPPHQDEHFNWSGILRIHLRDSMEKKSLNPFFRCFFEVILTSKSFS